MAELGYVVVPHNHVNYLPLRDAFINTMLDATQTPQHLSPDKFPGSMAVSLSRRHLGMIAKNDYVALEKSDGQRYMLFALNTSVFLIDRRMNFYVAEPNPQIIVPESDHERRADPNYQPELHHGTILDGELVLNQITNEYEYLIYDAVAINGDNRVATKGFRERMSAAEVWVVCWRVRTPDATGLLRLRCKDYFEKVEIRRLFYRIKKDDKGEYIYLNDDRRDGAICNYNDGVIFTPVGLPYTVKNCEQLLKWKPPHLDSVDFKLLLEPEVDKKTQKPSCRASIAYSGGGKHKLITLRQVYFPSWQRIEWAKNFNKYHESIVELSYDRKKKGEWKYIRQREDKSAPNFASTVISTMESIAEELLREELVLYLEKNSQKPPPEAGAFIAAKQRSEQDCKVRNDLFDAENKDYLSATPISTIPPPRIEVPQRRERRHRNHQRPTHEPPQEGARLQPDYSMDV